jgi:choline dehydrogenase-like flavoprotein
VLHAQNGALQNPELLASLPRLPWHPNRYGLYSAHQMSTCRLGGQARTHPLRPNGETVEVRGLYVADGSAFPACSGANPMLTIMALAHYTAQGLKATNTG